MYKRMNFGNKKGSQTLIVIKVITFERQKWSSQVD